MNNIVQFWFIFMEVSSGRIKDGRCVSFFFFLMKCRKSNFELEESFIILKKKKGCVCVGVN